MTPVEILKAARELIAKPERWTRGYMARGAHGEVVSVRSDDAVCWCLIGAIGKCAGDTQERAKACALLSAAIPGAENISEFNDSHDHAEVLGLFDRAIASAQP